MGVRPGCPRLAGQVSKGQRNTEGQIRLIEKANPCFRERKAQTLYPGYLLSHDTFTVGTVKGAGRVYLQAVADTFGSYAFGTLYTSRIHENAAGILCDKVLPIHEAQSLTTAASVRMEKHHRQSVLRPSFR